MHFMKGAKLVKQLLVSYESANNLFNGTHFMLI
jgi:hypothetical protein